MARLLVVQFLSNKVFCLPGSAICTVGLLIRLCASFKTSNNLTVRWPAIACLSGRFADVSELEWLSEKYVAFRHLVRFCWGYIRYIIMLHLAKRSGIQSSFCDFRHATTSLLGIHSRFSHLMQRPVSYLPLNYSLVHKPPNLPNNSEFKFALINYDHFPSMLSPNFRLSGGSLGYWTACNNVKHYCTVPYCEYYLRKTRGN